MLVSIFYTLNILLLLSGLVGIRQNSGERRFTIALIQALLGLPLLAGEYFYIAYHVEAQPVLLLLFSEVVFTLIWLSLTLRLRDAMTKNTCASRGHIFAETGVGVIVAAAAAYFLHYQPVIGIFESIIAFNSFGPVYFSAVFTLLTVLYTSWRLEQFWRALNVARRWEYKFLVVGSYLVCGSLAWSASYRLTYFIIQPKHLLLLALLLFFGWILMTFAVVKHRLLNRKIFVSRKVVYSFVIPSLLAVYFFAFGIVSLLMRIFELEMSFVLKWMFLAFGGVCVGLFAFSGKIRRRVHFFISTHFYVNKYEYRDEWLSLSQHLQGGQSEADVINALRQVLVESLYTTKIFIWLGDLSKEYRLVSSSESIDSGDSKNNLVASDFLIRFIQNHSHFHQQEKEPDSAWQQVIKEKEHFLTSLDLILITPISIGDQLVGLIGLGPEFTGGQYGHDDFDLLTVLGSQTATALLAVRMAEELAHSREQQAWSRLSAFVLHDIKNAATMLSLLLENAPKHIHEPEFQQDLLELVDDALKRMGRVEQRLATLKEEITPELRSLELCPFLQTCRKRMKVKLPEMKITLECRDKIRVRTDKELLFSILENLLLNAFEAQGEGCIVQIRVGDDEKDNDKVLLELSDNGPGIKEELLPDVLFEPFKTDKEGGSGIGLWQVKKMVTSLGGSILAENRVEGGARFVITLPLS